VDIVGRSRDLLESLRGVITREGLVASLAVNVEGKVLDHIRLERNVSQRRDNLWRNVYDRFLVVTAVSMSICVGMGSCMTTGSMVPVSEGCWMMMDPSNECESIVTHMTSKTSRMMMT